MAAASFLILLTATAVIIQNSPRADSPSSPSATLDPIFAPTPADTPLSLGLSAPPPVDPYHMPLIRMHDFADRDGAVCLDGSPGAFYFRKYTDPAHANDWLLHFKGAGWCYDTEDCFGRSQMVFGSSNFMDNVTSGWNGGILGPGDDTFGGFNKVILEYCDGASFTGDRTDPVPAGPGGNTSLFFRGRRIRDSIFKTLVRDHNLGAARDVLLTGCSSGGLSAYIHSDWVAATLRAAAPSLRKFRVAPASGFFLLHDNVANAPVYQTQMRNIFALSNSSGGVGAACAAAMVATMVGGAAAEDDTWKCMFAQYAYAHSTEATFVENSALDMWQTSCIFTAALVDGFPNQKGTNNGNCSGAAGHWGDCAGDPEKCNSTQMATMNTFSDDYMHTLQHGVTAARFGAPGNGAFVHSCHTHCEALSGPWFNVKIGNVSMGDAVKAWWRSDGTEPAAKHTYTPCRYHTQSGKPHMCNPTCAV